MKKTDLIKAALIMAASVAAQQASATAISCTTVASKTDAAVCTGGTGTDSYAAVALPSFTGSAGVHLIANDTAAAFGVCGQHFQGGSKFGLSTNGGSMTSATITAPQTAPTATAASGC